MKTYTQRRWFYTALVLVGVYAAFFVVLSQADTRSQLSMSMYMDSNNNDIPDHAEDWDGDGIADSYDDDDHDGIPNVQDPQAYRPEFARNRRPHHVDAETMRGAALSECGDGRDNDRDGDIDGEDADCDVSKGHTEYPVHEHCRDNMDNDRDGQVDNEDSTCIQSRFQREM